MIRRINDMIVFTGGNTDSRIQILANNIGYRRPSKKEISCHLSSSHPRNDLLPRLQRVNHRNASWSKSKGISRLKF